MQTALEIGLEQYEKRVKAAADAGHKTRYTAPTCTTWDQATNKRVPLAPTDCKCKPTTHRSNPNMSEGTARAAFGYTYSKRTGALTLTPWKPSKAKTTDRMLENVAACAAVGLSYWADGPDTNLLWAVDDDRVAHIVKIDRQKGTAHHACTHTYSKWTKEIGKADKPVPGSEVACKQLFGDNRHRPWSIKGRSIIDLLSVEPEQETEPEPVKPLYVNPGPTVPENPPKRREPKGPPPLGHTTAAEKRALKQRIEERQAASDKEMDEYAAAYAAYLRGEAPKPERPSEREAREAVAKGRNPFLGKASDVLVTKIGAEGQVESDAKLASAILTTFATGEPPEPEMEGDVANMVEGMSVEAAWELFVHDPTYFDDFNDDMLERLRKKAGRSGSYFLLIRAEIKRRSDARG